MKNLKVTSVALMISLAVSNISFAASVVNNDSNTPSMQPSISSAENCADINATVAETFANTAKMILPDNPEDNVYHAVANSGAEAVNEGSFMDDVFNFDLSSVSLLGGSIWSAITAAAEKAMESAKKAAVKAMKKAAESAIKSGINAVNGAYAKQLGKLSSKMGFAGPIMTTALGGIVPSITQTAGSCAMNLDANCASKISDAISKSAEAGMKSAVGKTASIATEMTEKSIDKAIKKGSDMVTDNLKNSPDFIKDAAGSAVNSARFHLYEGSEGLGSDVGRAINKAGNEAVDKFKNQGGKSEDKAKNFFNGN